MVDGWGRRGHRPNCGGVGAAEHVIVLWCRGVFPSHYWFYEAYSVWISWWNTRVGQLIWRRNQKALFPFKNKHLLSTVLNCHLYRRGVIGYWQSSRWRSVQPLLHLNVNEKCQAVGTKSCWVIKSFMSIFFLKMYLVDDERGKCFVKV